MNYSGIKKIVFTFVYLMLPSVVPNLYQYMLERKSNFLDYSANGYAIVILLITVIYVVPYIGRAAFLMSSVLFYLTNVFEIAHLYLFRSPISAGAYYSIFETDSIEAVEFIFSQFSVPLFAIVFLITLLHLIPGIFLYKSIKTVKLTVRFKTVFFIFCAAVFLVTFIYKKDLNGVIKQARHHSFVNAVLSYKAYKDDIKIIELFAKNAKKYFAAISDEGKQTYILVIGESTSNLHMQAYGYFRDTNIYTSKINNLYVFDDVVSPEAYTFSVLSYMLTFSATDNSKSILDGSLISVMKEAGFKTYWLTNQAVFDADTSLIAQLSSDADKKVMIRKTSRHEGMRNQYDEELLPHLDNALDEEAEKKFIIIHLQGSHISYSHRYPDSFKIFDRRYDDIPIDGLSKKMMDIYNTYDNSILYTDYVLSEIIRKLDNSTEQLSYMLYIGDHGEHIYEYRSDILGRSNSGSSFYPYNYAVPMFLWVNANYAKANSETIAEIPVYTKRKYTSDDLIHSVMQLSGVNCDEYIPEKSIFSPDFTEKQRFTEYGKYDYDKEMAEWESQYNSIINKFLTKKGL